MFDFAWSEIAVIGVVALIAIGPKDMPVAIRAVKAAIRKARGMAAEFQSHVDEMLREADLHEVRNSIAEIRGFDFKGAVERAVDPDGSLRQTFASNPLEPDPVIRAPAPAAEAPGEVAELVREPEAAPLAAPAAPEPDEAPAFIPPAFARREAAPDFVPPGIRRRQRA